MGREALRELQLDRLRATVKRVYQNVSPYRDAMQKKGMVPNDIQSLDDLRDLPFTNKSDLRDNYPFGLFASPMDEITRIQGSSGTTGKLTVVGYTQRDIETWTELAARSLACAGVRRGSRVHVAYGYGLFTGGLGAHYGAERIGATVIPMSGGNTQRQIMVMQDFEPTHLACTPSYALMLGETMRDMGVDASKLKLSAGIFGAEAWTESMRSKIEGLLGITALDIYGIAEIIGPGVAMECSCKNGMHVWEDHFIPEIINPETGVPLGAGEKGELVFSTITKEGMPLLRYRTHDVTSITYEPCACGRTHARINRLTGRTDDMLVVRGVNVFPSQIETALINSGEVEPHYLLVVDRGEKSMDTLEVWVEVSEQMFSDEVRRLEELRARLTHDIEATLGISVKLKLVGPHTIERSEGKAKRVWDRRNL